MIRWNGPSALAALLGAALCLSAPASAFDAKTVVIKVGFGPGGGFDLASRLVSRHLGRHLPGNPDVVVQNVPGGGSMRLTQMMFGSEPTDGSAIGSVNTSMALAPKLNPETAGFDPQKINWIGALTRDQHFCVIMKTTGIETLEQFLSGSFTMGASGKSSLLYTLAAAAKNALGGRYDIVTGFQSIPDIELAMRRGEVAGYCGISHSSLTTSSLMNEVNVIGGFGATKAEGYENLPRFFAAIEDPLKRRAAELLEVPLDFHFAFMAPADMSPETLAILRGGFQAMAEDPEFLADAERSNGPAIRFTSGSDMQAAFAEALASDEAVFEAARQLIK